MVKAYTNDKLLQCISNNLIMGICKSAQKAPDDLDFQLSWRHVSRMIINQVANPVGIYYKT